MSAKKPSTMMQKVATIMSSKFNDNAMTEIIDKAKTDMVSQEEKLLKLMRRVRVEYSIGDST